MEVTDVLGVPDDGGKRVGIVMDGLEPRAEGVASGVLRECHFHFPCYIGKVSAEPLVVRLRHRHEV